MTFADRIPLAERFWAKVDRRGPTDCWTWLAGLDGGGYGKISEGGKGGRTLKANRVSWMLEHGSEPTGFICHDCDNPKCVNPAHLYLGTPKSNMEDRARRLRGPIGSQCYNAKLDEKKVRVIKATRGAVRFEASSATVSHILAGRQWKHVA